MGANQSSHDTDNDAMTAGGGVQSVALSLSSSSSLAATTVGLAAAAPHGQQKFSTALSSSSPKSPKDLFIKRKPAINTATITTGVGSGNKTAFGNSKEAPLPDSPLPPMDTQQMTRGIPTRSSIIQGSFRRVKVLTNVPVPPVIPDEKFNRLSNVSLSSSSGFGSGSSQESTASSDSASSSTFSSFSAQTPGTGAHQPTARFTMPSLMDSNDAMPSSESAASFSSAATRKARMNLRLNIIPGNPVSSSSAIANESYDNPYGTTRFNQPRSPLPSPLASPLFQPGNDSLRSPQSSSSWSAAVTAGVTVGSRRSEITSGNNQKPSYGSTYRSVFPSDRSDGSVMMGQCDSLKSPTRSDYVELMCSTNSTAETRHSRSSFSSFDGSNYSSSSFNSSPNGTASSALDLTAMFQAGMNDNEVLSAWLGSIGFTEYFPNFIQAGYDMASAARMTTEDLTAIGITKPLHRKRIRAEIARLPSVDLNFGCDLPDTTAHFLQSINLTEYLNMFLGQNYTSCNEILNLDFDDLEDIGVKKLGHLKKLTLAIKYFRNLRRQTAQSAVMEEESKRYSMGSIMSQDSSQANNHPDDDLSSGNSRDSNSPQKRLLDKNQHQQRPYLSTFQALPTSPIPKDTPSESHWRPQSALGRYPAVARTPDSDEIILSRTGSSQKINSSNQCLSGSNSSIADRHCTLPRRKSVKPGAGKSIAKIMAQVFRTDKGSSAPSSPSKDQPDSSRGQLSSRDNHLSPSPPIIRNGHDLATFSKPGFAPLSSPHSNLSKTRDLISPDSFNELGSLSRFPPPPSPLLRDYPRDKEPESIDLEKTPVLSHRVFVSSTVPQSNAATSPSRDSTANHRGSSHPPAASSMPFAQDNIGTIKQRVGRQVPSVSSLIFREQTTLNGSSGVGELKLNHRTDHSSNEEVLDEISAMLGSLSNELDVAMEQLENDGH